MHATHRRSFEAAAWVLHRTPRTADPQSPARPSDRMSPRAETCSRRWPASFRESLGLHRLERQRLAQQLVCVTYLEAVGRRSVETARETNGAGGTLFLVGRDESLGLHAAKRHVD